MSKSSIYRVLSDENLLRIVAKQGSRSKDDLTKMASRVDGYVFDPEITDEGLSMREDFILNVYMKLIFLIPVSGFLILFWAMVFGSDSLYLPVLLFSIFGSWMIFSAGLRGAVLWKERFRWKRHKRMELPAAAFVPSNHVYIRWYEFPVGLFIALFFSYNPATEGIGVLSFFGVPGFGGSLASIAGLPV